MRSWVVLIGTMLVTLSACGGGDDGGGGPGNGGTTTGGGGSGGKGGTSATGGSVSGGGSPSGGGSAGSGGGVGGSGGSVGGSGGNVGGSGGGGTACNATTHACLPSAPADWTGPIAFYHGAGTAPACPGTFPTKEAEQHSSLTEGTAACNCSCDAPTGISCVGSARVCTTTPLACNFIGGSCGTSGNLVGPNSCITGSWAQGTYRVELPAPNGGSCPPKSNHTLPAPTWAEQTLRCGGPTIVAGTDCATGTQCVPSVPAPYKACVWRPGDFACPTAYYSEKVVAYDAFQDTRACSACTCGSPTGKKCGEAVFVSGCAGFVINYGSGSGCPVSTTGTASALRYNLSPSGTCAPGGGTLGGAVSKSGEVTYCCAK